LLDRDVELRARGRLIQRRIVNVITTPTIVLS
jgi:hypothetical protein